ncbi:hypothetical protein, partial [Stenotrophomonas indicatrix]|uniref:hypothetical protein n=1 Tax=Stenotrophomonas indicatrix TaxID=2045451 RepID=UPI003CE49DF1
MVLVLMTCAMVLFPLAKVERSSGAGRQLSHRPMVDQEADQRSRLSTPCGTWLAWASMAVPACC